MATKYTTRTATMRQSQVVDQRKIAVGKKIEIGGKEGTVVSDAKVETKEVETKDVYTDRLFVNYEGKSTNILDIISSGGGGDTPVVDGRIDISDGTKTWENVKKIIFDGVTITDGEEDGSIIITIVGGGEPVVVPELTTMNITGLTTESMYLFSGAGDYTLPSGYTAGDKYTNSYNRTNTSNVPVIKFAGTGTNGAFGFENLTSKLRLTFMNSNGTAIKTYESAVLNADATGTIGNWTYGKATVKSGKITFEGITFTVPSADLLGSWKAKVSVIQDDKEVKAIDGDEEYFAYITKLPEFLGDKFVIKMIEAPETRNTDGTWCSGIQYASTTTKYSGFTIDTIPIINSVYMADSDEVRGQLNIAHGGKTVSNNITGEFTDTKDTQVQNTFTCNFSQLNKPENGLYKIDITQQIHNEEGGSISKPATIESTKEGDQGVLDTYNTAYFEREDGDYGRIAGYIDENEALILTDDESYDSEMSVVGSDEIYNKQLVIYNKSLIFPSALPTDVEGDVAKAYRADTSTNPRYFIRKFKRHLTSLSQSDKFTIKVGGFTKSDDEDKELWLFVDASAYGYGIVGGRIDSEDYGMYPDYSIAGQISFVAESSMFGAINENDEVYIVVKINNSNASVTGNIMVE